jgi:hypothetical protein
VSSLPEIEEILNDPEKAETAFDWVEAAIERSTGAGDQMARLYPVLAPGVFMNELNVCEDYSCQCGWNATFSGRDPDRRERLDLLIQREPDAQFGRFKLLNARENGRLWTVKIAGDGDLGLDAVVRLLLA